MRYVRVSFMTREREGGVQRGVAKPKVLCHAHNHGGQVQTLKTKLHKLSTNALYTIVIMSQKTINYNVYDG